MGRPVGSKNGIRTTPIANAKLGTGAPSWNVRATRLAENVDLRAKWLCDEGLKYATRMRDVCGNLSDHDILQSLGRTLRLSQRLRYETEIRQVASIMGQAYISGIGLEDVPKMQARMAELHTILEGLPKLSAEDIAELNSALSAPAEEDDDTEDDTEVTLPV